MGEGMSTDHFKQDLRIFYVRLTICEFYLTYIRHVKIYNDFNYIRVISFVAQYLFTITGFNCSFRKSRAIIKLRFHVLLSWCVLTFIDKFWFFHIA